MPGVISDSERAQVQSKSDAELETIIDTYSKNADYSFRQAAVEEKHRRLKEQNTRNEGIQKSILYISIAVLILTAIGVAIGFLALVKQP